MRHESYKEIDKCCHYCKHLISFCGTLCCAVDCLPSKSLFLGEFLTEDQVRQRTLYLLNNKVTYFGICDCFEEK